MGIALQNRKKELGNDNRWTLQAQSLFGRVVLAAFRTEEALEVLKDTAERQLKVLGEHHADLYETENALILEYDLTQDRPSKLALFRKHLQYLEQQRGPQNRGVLAVKSLLGINLWRQNRLLFSSSAKALTEEGKSLMTEAYEMQLKLYGKEDNTTVEAAARLANYYEVVREWEKSESLHRLVLESYQKRFGEESPEALIVECRVSFALAGQQRAKEALEMIERIIPIQKKQLHENPDRILSSLYLVMSGIIKAGAHMGLNEDEAALKTLRGECTERMLGLTESSQKVPLVQHLFNQIRSLDNVLRDEILYAETRQWVLASARPFPFKELESFFPRNLENRTPASNIRKVKSWYTTSEELDLSSTQNADEDQSATFRRLRGEPEPEQESGPTPTQGWSCSRCEIQIPIADFFYRCYEPSCQGGKYAVCEKCHDSGLACLDFKHLTRRTKAYLVCNCCEKEIRDRHVFSCEICEDGLYHVCKSCYASGKRCPTPSHHMKKILQPCYKDYFWYGQLFCNSCGNVVEDGEAYEHCQICDGDDYDLCPGCLGQGIKCKDERHELVKKVWMET